MLEDEHSDAGRPGGLDSLWREPLVPFAVMGGLLFVLFNVLNVQWTDRPGRDSLVPVVRTVDSITRQAFWEGVGHVWFSWHHGLLVLATAFLCRGPRLFKLLFWFAAGSAVGLVLVDFGCPPVPRWAAHCGGLVTAVLMARAAAIGQTGADGFCPIMLVLGGLDGLADGQLPVLADLPHDLVISGMFAFMLAVNVVQCVTGIACAAFIWILWGLPWKKWLARYGQLLLGSTATAAIALILTAAPRVPDSSHATPAGQPLREPPVPVEQATKSLTGYLNIEPFEVRLEILVPYREVGEWIDVETLQANVIPVERQPEIATAVLKRFAEAFRMMIDGRPVTPAFRKIDLVQVTPDGIQVRQEPRPEPADTAHLGVVLAFETDMLPQDVTLTWQVFVPGVPTIPIVVVDPLGVVQQKLSPAAPVLAWQAALAGSQMPLPRTVPVSGFSIPLASLVIAVVCGLIWLFRKRQPANPATAWVVGLGLTVATFMYPALRWPARVPTAGTWTMGKDAASGILDRLLTNVYDASGIRNESKARDRLEPGVVSDRLEGIYRQGRQSLRIPQAGDTWARLEQVEITDIRSVQRLSGGELVIEAAWTISGSVNYFGYTRFRKRYCEGLVAMVPVDRVWKISQMHIRSETN